MDSGNVAEYLLQRARELPNSVALRLPRRPGLDDVDYQTLADQAARLAAHLQALGLGPGTRTLLAVPPGADLIRSVFALFLSGSAPVVIDPGMGLQKARACVRQTRPDGLLAIAPAQLLSRLFPRDFASVQTRVTVEARLWKRLARRELPAPQTAPTDEATAAVLFTSGSTGPPKGVVYTHPMFAEQVRLIGAHYGIESGEIDLPLLPVFALFDPAFGMTTVVPPIDPRKPAAVNPARLVAAIQEHRVTTSFGSPAIWAKVGQWCIQNSVTLPSVRRILMAGAPVPPHVLRQFRQILTHGEVHTPYGATEALPVSTISGSEVLDRTWSLTETGHGTCVGRAFPGVEVRILRLHEGPLVTLEGDWECPTGQVGEIIVRGPSVTQQYFDQPEATSRAKIADPDRPPHWHRMGDLGYLDAEGRLWFCGRMVERVQTSTGTLLTDKVEGVFNAHPKVARCALIGLGEPGQEKPMVVVEPEPKHFPKGTSAQVAFIEELRALGPKGEQASRITEFVFQKRLPVDVRHNAKIHRLTLKARYQR
ncbi:MAG: fatty acid CoA ligase family protein [Opitutales bacterium]